MGDFAQRVYNRLPPVRNAMATLRGWQIQRQRYGAVYRRTVAELEERGNWTRAQFDTYQAERLRAIVRIAATHVPYYRQLFAAHGLSAGDIRDAADLPKIPLLEKNTVREDPLQLVHELMRPEHMLRERTTGSTGTPVWVYKPRDAVQQIYAFLEVRSRRVAGMRFGEQPYIMLGASAVAPREQTRPPFWAYNRVHKQLYMSVYHLAPQFLGYYCEEFLRRPYHAVFGLPSSIHQIADYALEYKLGPFAMRTAITSGEMLHPHQRAAIEAAFGLKVYDKYGCSENCVFANECTHGRMHLSPDFSVVEVVDDEGHPLPDGTTGHLACTGLINEGQPLIRYLVGDRAAIDTMPCTCGSALPVLRSLDGRESCGLVTRDGRFVSRLSRPLMGVTHVKGYQVIQEDLDHFRVRVLVSEGFTAADSRRVRANIAFDVGNVDITIEPVHELPRGPGGKIELTKSHLTPELLESVRRKQPGPTTGLQNP